MTLNTSSHSLLTKKDFKSRKGQARDACNKLTYIWQSVLAKSTKIKFFRARVESILLYGAETWTINNELEERLNGKHQFAYAGPESLREEPPTKDEIYGELTPISKIVARRRARFTGHCFFRAKDQVISDPLLWRLPCPRRAKWPLTYPDTSFRATGFLLGELAQAIADRALWRGAVSAVSTAVE